MTLLAMHPGAAYRCESLEGKTYRHDFDKLVRPEALTDELPTEYDAFLVPCRTPSQRVDRHRENIRRYLDNGGTVVAMGETGPSEWLPNIDFKFIPTNFWWWLEEAASLGIAIAAPDHPLFFSLSERDVTWHLHGSFGVPEGALSLIDDSEGRSILYIDEISTPGRMVVTSLDPFFHHGHHFMPATTRFLNGFLPWFKDKLQPVGGVR